jgi:hypothetical protein
MATPFSSFNQSMRRPVDDSLRAACDRVRVILIGPSRPITIGIPGRGRLRTLTHGRWRPRYGASAVGGLNTAWSPETTGATPANYITPPGYILNRSRLVCTVKPLCYTRDSWRSACRTGNHYINWIGSIFTPRSNASTRLILAILSLKHRRNARAKARNLQISTE